MIVLGIDPGSLCTGYGVVRRNTDQPECLGCGTIRPAATLDHPGRLKFIYDRVTQLIAQHDPDCCAVEMPVYGHNPQSMLKLGRAQAAAMLAAQNADVSVRQYTPKEIKKAVTGNGNASKEQVSAMVNRLLNIKGSDLPSSTDASDALAVAVCHAHRSDKNVVPPARGDWATFLRANPERTGS